MMTTVTAGTVVDHAFPFHAHIKGGFSLEAVKKADGGIITEVRVDGQCFYIPLTKLAVDVWAV